jgi:hypothetical protein
MVLQTVLDAWNQVFAYALVRGDGVTAYFNVAAVTIGVILVTQWLRRSRVIRREGATDEPDETPALGTEPDASEPAPVLSELSVRAWRVDRTLCLPAHTHGTQAAAGRCPCRLRNGALLR